MFTAGLEQALCRICQVYALDAAVLQPFVTADEEKLSCCSNCIRLCFARQTTEQFREGVARLGKALAEYLSGKREKETGSIPRALQTASGLETKTKTEEFDLIVIGGKLELAFQEPLTAN